MLTFDSKYFLKRLKLVTVSLYLMVLVGCGFALRSEFQIPLQAQAIWIEFKEVKNLNLNLQSPFESLAKNSGLFIEETAENKILVTAVTFRRITTTLSPNAKVDEYTLRGELNFDILDKEDQLIATQLDAFSERTFQYDANDAAASNSREAFLRDEVWRSLAQQMLRQYAAYFRLK